MQQVTETLSDAKAGDVLVVRTSGRGVLRYKLIEFAGAGNRAMFTARPTWRNTRRDRYYSFNTNQQGTWVYLSDWGTFANKKQLLTGARGHEWVVSVELERAQ